MVDKIEKEHQVWMNDFDVYRKKELDEGLRVETILNERIAKFEKDLIEMRKKHVFDWSEELKDHCNFMKSMEIERNKSIELIGKNSVGMEMMIGEMKIAGNMSKNTKTNAVRKDANLINYGRQFEDLKKLSNEILETLKKELNSRPVFEQLKVEVRKQLNVLTKLCEFDEADLWFEKRKEVFNTVVVQINQVLPHFESILSYIDLIDMDESIKPKIDECSHIVSFAIKKSTMSILALPELETIKHLENSVEEENKAIDSSVIGTIARGIQSALEN